MRRISKDTVQEVSRRLDALAVVQDYIRLEKRGGRYWGRCPFHAGGQEKTPSFKVEPDQKLYYCFACQKGGGIIDFVMEMDKISYPEAIRTLARKFGVEIVYEEGGAREDAEGDEDNTRREELYELYRRTAVSFQHFLLEKPEGRQALDYLLSRKISIEMIRRFRLGYSPASRNWLYGFLQGKGYSAEFLDGSGLFSSNYRGAAFFSDRLMFPIADRHGRVVAFGGRALPWSKQSDGREPPKYINSREIETYKKGQTLYSLDLALPEIRRSKTACLAEGYMDVIALHQAGIANSIACCGTAFTDEQARLLKNWADNIVLVFDSDEAGQKAAGKTIITCRKNGLTCSLYVPNGAGTGNLKDPADILQNFGAETLNNSMKSVIIDTEYIVARAKTLHDISTPKGKAGAMAMLYPYLDAMESNTEREDCIGAAADELRADKASALEDYARWRRGGGNSVKAGGGERDGGRAIQVNDELLLLTVVSVNPDLYPRFRASVGMGDIEDPGAKELFVALEECFINDESGTGEFLARIGSETLRNFIIERGTSPEFKAGEKFDPGKYMEDGIRRMNCKKLRRRRDEIGAELRQMERNSGFDAGDVFQELITEKMHLDAEIKNLEGR